MLHLLGQNIHLHWSSCWASPFYSVDKIYYLFLFITPTFPFGKGLIGHLLLRRFMASAQLIMNASSVAASYHK